MLKNGYTGPGELDDSVAEFLDGKRHGLGVDHHEAGEYHNGKLHGYAINNMTKNINHYNDGIIDEQLITKYINGNVWIGDDEVGILIRENGTIGHKKPIYVENPVYVLTKQKEYKRISMVDLKMRKTDFRKWYCPIWKANWSINPVGEICSGVCANIRHNRVQVEGNWKSLKKLKLRENNFCKTEACFCDADILQPKAIDKKTFDYFLANKNFQPYQLEELPILEESDEIIAVGRGTSSMTSEVHFHIGPRCNYDCSYCPTTILDKDGGMVSGVHDNFSPHLSLVDFQHGLNLINEYLPPKPNRRIYITGGEPTLNPLIKEFVQHSIDMGYECRISTNGTAPERKYRELLDLGAYLEFSFHVEFTIDKVIKRVADLVPDYKQDKITVKCMSFEDTPFAQKVQAIIPKDKEIYYYPIYGRDLEHKFYFDKSEEEKEKAEVKFND
jgi:organic radical activating enzyme